MLSQQLLDELKSIIKEDFNLQLSNKEVLDIANSLVSYFDLLDNIQQSNYGKSPYASQ